MSEPMNQQTGAELRSFILAQTDLKTESLLVPEWGGVTVGIREMKAKARNKVIQDATLVDGKRDLVKFYPLITILSVYDVATDKALFELADLDALNEQGGTAMERVCQVAVKLSGLDPSAFAEIKNA